MKNYYSPQKSIQNSNKIHSQESLSSLLHLQLALTSVPNQLMLPVFQNLPCSTLTRSDLSHPTRSHVANFPGFGKRANNFGLSFNFFLKFSSKSLISFIPESLVSAMDSSVGSQYNTCCEFHLFYKLKYEFRNITNFQISTLKSMEVLGTEVELSTGRLVG